jgi:hypothetical protein
MAPLTEPLKWLKGIEQTAYRVALLMSGDLTATVELIQRAPSLSGEPFESRLYKLLLFAVSPPLPRAPRHPRARAQGGLARPGGHEPQAVGEGEGVVGDGQL